MMSRTTTINIHTTTLDIYLELLRNSNSLNNRTFCRSFVYKNPCVAVNKRNIKFNNQRLSICGSDKAMHTLKVSAPKIIASRKSSNASLKVSFSPPDNKDASKDASSSSATSSTWRLGCVGASDTFDRLMCGEERRHAALEKKSSLEVAVTTTASDAIDGGVTSLEIGDEEVDDDFDDETRERLRIKRVVERAWSLIRHHIVEMSFARRKQRSLSWSVLKHTLDTLKHGDSARQQLYRKYLHPQPDPLACYHGLDLLTVDVSKLATSPRVYQIQTTAASKSRALQQHVTPFTSRLQPGKWMSRVECDLLRELNKTDSKH